MVFTEDKYVFPPFKDGVKGGNLEFLYQPLSHDILLENPTYQRNKEAPKRWTQFCKIAP